MLCHMRKLRDLLFGRYLWVTNTVSCGALLSMGDVIQQHIEVFNGCRDPESLDCERIGRMGTIGLLQGFPNHAWYLWLDRFLPGKSLAIVAKKVLADQLIASPFFSSTFFVGASLLEGCSLVESVNEFRSKFVMVYMADCAFWPPSQFVNFLFVPAVYRVVYVNTLTIAWNAFLSYAKHFDRLDKHNDLYPSGHRKRKETSSQTVTTSSADV